MRAQSTTAINFLLISVLGTFMLPVHAQKPLVIELSGNDSAATAPQAKAKAVQPSANPANTAPIQTSLPAIKSDAVTLDKPSAETAKKQANPGGFEVVPGAPRETASYLMPSPTDQCGFSVCNPPVQPQVAGGRCQPCITAIDCAANCGTRLTWRDMKPYPFQPLRQGEYLGPVRLPATVDYRIRVGDRIRFVFVRSRELLVDQYRLRVGDELAIRSVTDDTMKMGDLTTGIKIQPDGMIYLLLVGPVRAEGLTIPQLRRNLEVVYRDKLKSPAIDVQPIRTNTPLEDIVAAVDNRAGQGGQSFTDTVHPDGTVRLVKLGTVCVQGMTLDEIKREVNLRYAEVVTGLEVEPVLDLEAQHFVFIYGEVTEPGRFQLLGPTSVTQALALAKGIRLGGNSREIVVFRRAEDWRLLATRIDVRGMHIGKIPTPADEIWVRDNDLIIVPPTPIKVFDNFVKQVFTDGIYGVFPFGGISITRFQGGSFSSN